MSLLIRATSSYSARSLIINKLDPQMPKPRKNTAAPINKARNSRSDSASSSAQAGPIGPNGASYEVALLS